MLKITLAVAVAAAVLTLTTAPLATPSMAQDLKMAQGVDVQIGRDRDRTVGGMTQTSPSASAQGASPSGHEDAAAW